MKGKNIKQKIKEYFFVNSNSKHRVREIERILQIPLPSVIRYCKELQEEGILITQKIGSIAFYTADKVNERYLLEKKLFNLKSLYDSGLVKFLKIELSNPLIIVFGSYSKGEDTEKSDIDLYIETPSKKEIKLDKFEKDLKREIHLFRHKKIKEIKNKNLLNNIINGIVLNGFMEVFK